MRSISYLNPSFVLLEQEKYETINSSAVIENDYFDKCALIEIYDSNLSSLSIFVLLLKSEKISNYPIRCMMFQYFNISSFKFSSSLDIFLRFP
jgi:hypothetical protein